MQRNPTSTSASYRLAFTEKFKKTYSDFKKTHFLKKSKVSALEAFIEEVSGFLQEVVKDPFNPDLSDPEGFPAGAAKQGLQLRKKRWSKCPGLQGKNSKVRLLFIVSSKAKCIFPLWLYSHKEYKKRPPEKELKREINKVFAEILAERKNK